MNRKNYVDKLIKILKDIEKNYDTYKHTQVIIGFPGETETDFNKTLQVLKECNFDYITITGYKDRPGTKSSLLKNHIPEKEIDKRLSIITLFDKENRNKQLWKRFQKCLNRQIHHVR